jgi:hypothetical protein
VHPHPPGLELPPRRRDRTPGGAIRTGIAQREELLMGLIRGVMKKGDANIWVSNVHPYVRDNQTTDPVAQNGGVEFVINVDYFSPLLVATTITVFDEVVNVRLGEEL